MNELDGVIWIFNKWTLFASGIISIGGTVFYVIQRVKRKYFTPEPVYRLDASQAKVYCDCCFVEIEDQAKSFHLIQHHQQEDGKNYRQSKRSIFCSSSCLAEDILDENHNDCKEDCDSGCRCPEESL